MAEAAKKKKKGEQSDSGGKGFTREPEKEKAIRARTKGYVRGSTDEKTYIGKVAHVEGIEEAIKLNPDILSRKTVSGWAEQVQKYGKVTEKKREAGSRYKATNKNQQTIQDLRIKLAEFGLKAEKKTSDDLKEDPDIIDLALEKLRKAEGLDSEKKLLLTLEVEAHPEKYEIE